MDDATRCPCLSGLPYGECCGPLHRGERPAPTAEALMRSRYSAFAVEDTAYLGATWHPSTRPAELDLVPGRRWRRLDILATDAGGPFDDAGTVEFVAMFRDDDATRGRLHELSRFVREDGAWRYVDGDVRP
ncbi:YchJ family protein [Isoptericola sp. b408]|uniref:YchJ family protein n=1 Tax=Isoptericola sp. b408 TaxID=3064653 RepID=UPI002713F958|nr:YchJ family protein [Isoptericola sp. b408]MDO8150171.1 YchJ family protein [Isoptericola sp. b408]